MRATSEHIEKLVAERHNAVRQSYEALLIAIAANDRQSVQEKNARLLEELQALGAVVAREHWPDWLASLINNTNRFKTNHSNGQATWVAHLKCLMQNYDQMQNYQWFAEPDAKPAFDVDQLIAKAKAQHKVDDLYQGVIQTLQALADSGEMDSVKAVKDLEAIIQILKNAKKGSFSSQIAAWSFARRFVPNLISAYAKRSDVVGPAIEAFEKTAEELDVNFKKAAEQVVLELNAAVKDGFSSDAATLTAEEGFPLLPEPELR